MDPAYYGDRSRRETDVEGDLQHAAGEIPSETLCLDHQRGLGTFVLDHGNVEVSAHLDDVGGHDKVARRKSRDCPGERHSGFYQGPLDSYVSDRCEDAFHLQERGDGGLSGRRG